jgi:hypothetical protein
MRINARCNVTAVTANGDKNSLSRRTDSQTLDLCDRNEWGVNSYVAGYQDPKLLEA